MGIQESPSSAGTQPEGSGSGGAAGVAEKGLRSGALGLVSSVVIGVASTAPAYSLAATLGFVVIAVGLQAPAIMVIAFLPMLCIAFAYSELNRAEPDCGTTFTWAARAFGPRAGWMGGWGIIAADIIVMANLAQIAGQYLFLLLGADGLASDRFWVTVAGVGWIIVMTWICYIGIEVSAQLQKVLLSLEIVVIAAFVVVALVKVYGGDAPDGSLTPALSWFNPFEISSFSGFTEGILLAIFIYWGWDTAVAVNEETADPERTPGRAAVISTILLLALYGLMTVASQAYAGVGEEGIGLGNEENAEDVLAVLGDAVFGTTGFGAFMAQLLVLLVLTSAAASTQTTILPTARASLSMAVFRAIPRAFSRIHPRYLTPTVSTVTMGIASVVFYVALTLVSDNVLADSIASIGVMIAFYYGLTGFTCVWYFRRQLGSARDLLLRGVLPLIGGVILFAALGRSLYDMWQPDYGDTSWTVPGLGWHVGGVFLLAVGTLLLGVVLMVACSINAPAYFRGEVLNRQTQVRVLEDGTGVVAGPALPDSPSQQALVLPPDVPDPTAPDPTAPDVDRGGRHRGQPPEG